MSDSRYINYNPGTSSPLRPSSSPKGRVISATSTKANGSKEDWHQLNLWLLRANSPLPPLPPPENASEELKRKPRVSTGEMRYSLRFKIEESDRILPKELMDAGVLQTIVFGRTDTRGRKVPIPLIECLTGPAKVDDGNALVFDMPPKAFILEISNWPGYPSLRTDMLQVFAVKFPNGTPFTKAILAQLIALAYHEVSLMKHGISYKDFNDGRIPPEALPDALPYFQLNMAVVSLYRDSVWRIPRLAFAKVRALETEHNLNIMV